MTGIYECIDIILVNRHQEYKNILHHLLMHILFLRRNLIMNKVKLMRNIYCYIDRCFKDAYKMENRKYDKTTYSIDFILFKSKEDEMYEFCPVLKCLYKRVYTRVIYRLNHNLEKNFGVRPVLLLKNNDPINHAVHIGYNQIDPNHTQAFFKLCNAEDDTFIAFDISDDFTECCVNGENLYNTCVYYTKRYGTLVCTYRNLTIEAWESLPRDNGRKHLPDDLFHNPEAFKELYKKAFNEEIGCRYDFIYSKGLKRI